MLSQFDLVRAIGAVVFAAVGFFISKGVPYPKSWGAWVLWALGALIAGHVFPTVILVGYKSTGLYFCDALQGLGIGILAGFMIHRGSRERSPSETNK